MNNGAFFQSRDAPSEFIFPDSDELPGLNQLVGPSF